MSNHHSLTESLARERHAARYAHATRPARADAGQHVGARPGTLRSRAGWLLVGAGLKLALPGGNRAGQATTLLGR